MRRIIFAALLATAAALAPGAKPAARAARFTAARRDVLGAGAAMIAVVTPMAPAEAATRPEIDLTEAARRLFEYATEAESAEEAERRWTSFLRFAGMAQNTASLAKEAKDSVVETLDPSDQAAADDDDGNDARAATALPASLRAKAFAARGDARFALGRARSQILGDYSAAIVLAPDESEHWAARASALERMGDAEAGDAVVMSRLAAAAGATVGMLPGEPTSKEVVNDDDVFGLPRRLYGAAARDYAQAVVLEPESSPRRAQLLSHRGAMLTLLGEHTGALDAFRRAAATVALDIVSRPSGDASVPSAVTTHDDLAISLALAELQAGDADKGAAIVEVIENRHRVEDGPQIHLAASAVLWTMGMFVESRSYWADAIGTDPRLGDDLFLRLAMRWPPKAVELAANVRGSAFESVHEADAAPPASSGGTRRDGGEPVIAWGELSSRCASVRSWVGREI